MKSLLTSRIRSAQMQPLTGKLILESDRSIFDNPVLTVTEAASLLRLSTKTVRKFARHGAIPHKKISGEIRFLRSELIEFLKGD